MRKHPGSAWFISIILILSACTTPNVPTENPPSPTMAVSTESPAPAPDDTQTPTIPLASPTTSVNTPESIPATSSPTGIREEAIMILQPASGSRVVNPLLLEGLSDPAFEGRLGVNVLNAEGGMLFQTFTNILADVGQRGPFSVELPVQVTADTNVFIQVYMMSPRDGGITHLSSVGVILKPSGTSEIVRAEPFSERITIFEPVSAAAISGGTLQIEGFGLASFEQTLLIEVLDEEGSVLGSTPVTVQAPDLGQPGSFRASIPYTVSRSMPGRVVVRDISPAFGGDVHRTSVEVTLEP